jgi:hypothetical protein
MGAVLRDLKPRGELVTRMFPRDGFYRDTAPGVVATLPKDAPLSAQFRTAYHEATLRARLAAKGLIRGLQGTGVLGVGRLYASVIRKDGSVEHLGLICTKVITDAGVAAIVDDFDNGGFDVSTFNFHGCGTGTTAEAAGDTALVTESTTALNPNNTRATGTRSQPAANQFRSVGTVTFDDTAAITEHGLFSQEATGGGTLFDRSVFAAINVVSADSIQFTYTVSFSSGG